MAQVASALTVGMETFKKLASNLSAQHTVCVRGRHAVGKSEGVYQVASMITSDFYKNPENSKAFNWAFEKGLPVVERRLSQMTEGDIVGLPFMHGEDSVDSSGRQVSYASTQFKPCDWLIEACKRPVLLFLDERNRALEGVKQAVFQLADSKKFYGYELHPETRIIIAENVGEEYQVQACDPAEISRCAAVVRLEPSVEEWLDYAKTRCHLATVEFIRANQGALEHNGAYEPDKKYPDRRAWFKFDQEAQRLDLFNNPENDLLYTLAGAFLGVELAHRFSKFCKERDREVSAKDILDSWRKSKRRLMKGGTISNETYIECVNKLASELENVNLTQAQAEEVAKFMWDAPAEPRMALYASLMKIQKNLLIVHEIVTDLIVATTTGKEIPGLPATLANDSKEDFEENSSSATTKKGRGAKKKV